MRQSRSRPAVEQGRPRARVPAPAAGSSSTCWSIARSDIGRAGRGGRALAWTSRAGFAGPWFYEPTGLGFLRSFGAGLSTACGLDHAFFPAGHRRAIQLPGEAGQALRLARASGMTRPGNRATAAKVGRETSRSSTPTAKSTASVDFGNCSARRRIDARRVAPHDPRRGSECSAERTPHVLLYYVNLVQPVVDDGSELLVPATSVEALGDYPADGYGHARSRDRLRRAGLRARTRGEAGSTQSPWRWSIASSGSAHVPGVPPRSAQYRCPGGCSARARTSSGSSRPRIPPSSRQVVESAASWTRRAAGRSTKNSVDALVGEAALDGFAGRVARLLT